MFMHVPPGGIAETRPSSRTYLTFAPALPQPHSRDSRVRLPGSAFFGFSPVLQQEQVQPEKDEKE
jgi:hypothetical protein